MSDSKREDEAAYRPPAPPPIRRDRPEEWRWPSPTPLPPTPTEDVGKILKQILDRLDAIEKRLEKIEKALTEKQAFIR
jgi:hypothetical protein